jgi:hypothetical protein
MEMTAARKSGGAAVILSEGSMIFRLTSVHENDSPPY